MDSVFLLIDRLVTRIILLSMTPIGRFLNLMMKFFKLLKRRIDIFNAETQLKFILEN